MAMYTSQGAGLLVALVALQQTWGVDFDTAVTTADRCIDQYLARHGSRGVELDQVVELMRQVVPRGQPGE